MILRLTIFFKIHNVVVFKVNKRLLKSERSTVPTRPNPNVIGTTGNLGDVFY